MFFWQQTTIKNLLDSFLKDRNKFVIKSKI